MKKIFAACILALSVLWLNAQNKELSPKAIMTNRSLSPEKLGQMQWARNSNHFFFIRNNLLCKVSPNGKREDILSLGKINIILLNNNFGKINRFPQLFALSDSQFVFFNDSLLLLLNPLKENIRQVNTISLKAENQDVDLNNFYVAFTLDDNLYVSANNKITPVGISDKNGVVYGKSVHRDEFGIEKGTFWSPKGNFLAFYKMDESMVTEYPIVTIEDPIATSQNIRYPMAGTKNHFVKVGVFDVSKNTTTYLQTNHWNDQYLTNISWSPDEKFIYMAVLNRNQKEMMLNKYNVSDGSFAGTIFKEENDKYVEPLHPLFFLDDEGKDFIWQSQRNGYNHLYLYNSQNNSCRALTSGNWVVNDIVGYNKKNNMLFFAASCKTPLEKEIYTLNLKTGLTTPVSPVEGTNNALVSYDGSYWVNVLSNTEVSNRVTLLNNKGKQIEILLEENKALKNILADISIFSIKADDQTTDLYCRLLKPVDFDASKKYPVIVYVYGGPHNQLVTNSWTGGAGLFLHYLAQKGYLVFTLDNRGTANRGLKFEQAIYKNIGQIEASDQMAGVSWLLKQPYVDTARIGVHGWSYGGFMAIYLMLHYPEIFKVGVAGGPVCDWKYYEVMYGERYMSTPEENPEGYKKASLINHIKNLNGKLLVIHGDNDPTVVWQHSLMLLKEAVNKDVLLDYMVYPGHEHNVGGTDRAHLMRKIEAYFNDFL
ncbi:MAG: Prolyl tripeptidyl peptidase precursor [Bacteroidetes bacterium ADurb.Bin408]|nr:MAG: Prolyl tripeptidyl peptidase precursor [Bacteroidetes bacterium ADurb.Bin408]